MAQLEVFVMMIMPVCYFFLAWEGPDRGRERERAVRYLVLRNGKGACDGRIRCLSAMIVRQPGAFEGQEGKGNCVHC